MSFRSWVTVITLVLLGLVIYFAWPDILQAWHIASRVNWWILVLIIPVQLASYYSTGGMIFSYLNSKGNLQHASQWTIARMALELNFVNHVFPSGGAAGISYMDWLLGFHGVTPGRATIAQVIRYVVTFVSFVMLLVLAVLILILDHTIARPILVISFLMVLACIGLVVGAVSLLGSKRRLDNFSLWIVKTGNQVISWITRGRKQNSIKSKSVDAFFDDLHKDYLDIKRDKALLLKPFLWSIPANALDVFLLWIAFWALGTPIDPATLFIAFGLSGAASIVAVTPGGAGIYEAIMIAFLASSGVSPDVAIAGTLLARVTLVIGTIAFGYVFYQMTINHYGKRSWKTTQSD